MFPAHAGMDRLFGLIRLRKSSCSPHTRGWTAELQGQHSPCPGVPRTRGDGPSRPGSAALSSKVFPAHAGMDRIELLKEQQRQIVFPAHAGMDRW